MIGITIAHNFCATMFAYKVFFVLADSVERILFRPNPWSVVESREKQTLPHETKAENPEPSAKGREPREEWDELYEEYKVALDQWMETEKPYTNRDFKLADMMQILPINRSYMAQFFKAAYGCNFYQLVNRYRVEEAKRLIRENPHRSLTEVSDLCGFSSLTMFGRIFARETGKTPSQWSLRIDPK